MFINLFLSDVFVVVLFFCLFGGWCRCLFYFIFALVGWLLSFLFVCLMIFSFFSSVLASHRCVTDDGSSVSSRPVSFHLHGLRCGGGGS